MENDVDQLVLPPPRVARKIAHELDLNDVFFNTLKVSYGEIEFTKWFLKCKKEHRFCYVIEDELKSKIVGLCILKREDGVFNLGHKVLKVCLFKIAEGDRGNRLGELLLKSVFEYCDENGYEGTFSTIKPDQKEAIQLFETFGFERCGESKNEFVFGKKFRFSETEEQALAPFDFHVKFGPSVTKFNGNNTYIVPIKPKYYYALFPEEEVNIELFPRSQAYGNSIKKVYISRSNIRGIKKGDNLLFYISDLSKLGAIGIVENVLRTAEYSELKGFVKNITVYPDKDLADLLNKEVVAIQFRRVKFIRNAITLKDLIDNAILAGAPQSITKIKKGKIEWLKCRM